MTQLVLALVAFLIQILLKLYTVGSKEAQLESTEVSLTILIRLLVQCKDALEALLTTTVYKKITTLTGVQQQTLLH